MSTVNTLVIRHKNGKETEIGDSEVMAVAEALGRRMAEVVADCPGDSVRVSILSLAALCVLFELAADGVPEGIQAPIRAWAKNLVSATAMH